MTELVCPYCGSHEYADIYDDETDQDGHHCNECDEFFLEPIEDYEFDEMMKERIAEDKADEARDMGL